MATYNIEIAGRWYQVVGDSLADADAVARARSATLVRSRVADGDRRPVHCVAYAPDGTDWTAWRTETDTAGCVVHYSWDGEDPQGWRSRGIAAPEPMRFSSATGRVEAVR